MSSTQTNEANLAEASMKLLLTTFLPLLLAFLGLIFISFRLGYICGFKKCSNIHKTSDTDALVQKAFKNYGLFKLLPILLIALCGGCETYQKSVLTPDGFNYTCAVNHNDLSVDQHWFGLTWNLKPGK